MSDKKPLTDEELQHLLRNYQKAALKLEAQLDEEKDEWYKLSSQQGVPGKMYFAAYAVKYINRLVGFNHLLEQALDELTPEQLRKWLYDKTMTQRRQIIEILHDEYVKRMIVRLGVMMGVPRRFLGVDESKEKKYEKQEGSGDVSESVTGLDDNYFGRLTLS